MPFRNLQNRNRPITSLTKAEIVNPEIEAAVNRIARTYRDAIQQLNTAVQTAAAETAANNLDEFRIIVSDAIAANMQTSLGLAVGTTSREAWRQATQSLRRLPRQVRAELRFDGRDPRAIAWARLRAGNLIAQIETEALQAVQLIIADSLNNGIPMAQTAQRIERVVGLHDRWQRAVENLYQREVNANLTRGLTSEQATVQAQQAAEKYRTRLVRARAKNIARTELSAAQNFGQYLGWIQASDQGLINLSTARKEWIAGPSGWRGISVCDICAPMDGQQVPVNGAFSNGLLLPPAHPNCRCTTNLVPAEPPKEVK